MDIVTHKQFRQMLADKAREHRIPLQGISSRNHGNSGIKNRFELFVFIWNDFCCLTMMYIMVYTKHEVIGYDDSKGI